MLLAGDGAQAVANRAEAVDGPADIARLGPALHLETVPSGLEHDHLVAHPRIGTEVVLAGKPSGDGDRNLQAAEFRDADHRGPTDAEHAEVHGSKHLLRADAEAENEISGLARVNVADAHAQARPIAGRREVVEYLDGGDGRHGLEIEREVLPHDLRQTTELVIEDRGGLIRALTEVLVALAGICESTEHQLVVPVSETDQRGADRRGHTARHHLRERIAIVNASIHMTIGQHDDALQRLRTTGVGEHLLGEQPAGRQIRRSARLDRVDPRNGRVRVRVELAHDVGGGVERHDADAVAARLAAQNVGYRGDHRAELLPGHRSRAIDHDDRVDRATLGDLDLGCGDLHHHVDGVVAVVDGYHRPVECES